MGQSEASAPVRRYNAARQPKPRFDAAKTPASPQNSGDPLTPEELAEFMVSLDEDDAPNAPVECADDDFEYND